MPRWLVPPLILLVACDDTVFVIPTEPYTADWDGMTALIDDHCAACHAPGAGNPVVLPDHLLIDAQDGTGNYVVAGDASASLFYTVLEENRMPVGSPLPQSTKDSVKAWIDAGAPVPTEDTL